MIGLRDVRVEDNERILRWRNSPNVAKFMFTDRLISPEEHERWFKKMLGDTDSRYWIIVCDNEDVGLVNVCNIDRTNSRCHWAFYVADPNVRGRGVGSFAGYSILRFVFDELKLNRLCGEVLATNESVLRMHENFGFRQEGILREHVQKQGIPVDVVCVAMLRREWVSVRPEVETRLRNRGLLQQTEGSCDC